MPAPAALPESHPLAAPGTENGCAENRERHCRVLNRLIDVGANIAEALDPGARDPALPPLRGTLDVAQAFHLVARSVRQAILLADTLAEPLPPTPEPRAARIPGQPGEAIGHPASSERTETFGTERLEALERPERLDALPDRAVPDLILDIRRDLGRAALPFTGPQPRFTAPGLAAMAMFAPAPPAQGGATAGPPPFHHGKHDP